MTLAAGAGPVCCRGLAGGRSARPSRSAAGPVPGVPVEGLRNRAGTGAYAYSSASTGPVHIFTLPIPVIVPTSVQDPTTT